MVEGAGMKCIKYLMIIFNVLFLFAGLVLVAIGAVAQYQQSKINYVSSAAILIIVVGSVIFLLSFLGCFGAINENRFILGLFGVLMIIICILCIAAIIVTFVFKSQVSAIWKQPLKDSLKTFNPKQKINFLLVWWPTLQYDEKCCGVDNSSDWRSNTYFNGSIPASCCNNKNETGICGPTETPYSIGCAEKITATIERFIAIVGIIVACIVVLQILGSVFAFCLAHAIHKDYTSV